MPAARPGRLAAQEHAEVVVDAGDQQRPGPEQGARHGRQALGPTAPVPGGKDDRQAALRTDGWQEAHAGEDHAEPHDSGHGADVVGKGAQEAPRVQNGEHGLTKEVADVRAGQVQKVGGEGAPLDGEAEKPEDQPVAHQAAQTEEQEDVVHDGRRRQHGDLLDGQETAAVELGGLAHAGTHLRRCRGGGAVRGLLSTPPQPAPASRWARLHPQGFPLARNLPLMQETQVRSLDGEGFLEKEMATHSSILAWEIPWTDVVAGYSSWGSKESDRSERLSMHAGSTPKPTPASS